jgi:hypothetical protein
VLLVNGNESTDWRRETKLIDALTGQGYAAAVVDPRGVGKLRPALRVAGHSYEDPLSGVEENLAYNAFLVGRSLLGMRVADVRAAVGKLVSDRRPSSLVLCARKDAALVACLATAVEPKVNRLAVQEMPLSYLPLFEAEGHPINAASILPGMLSGFGDIPDVLATISPRSVLAASPRFGLGRRTPSFRQTDRPFTDDPAVLLDWLRQANG